MRDHSLDGEGAVVARARTAPERQRDEGIARIRGDDHLSAPARRAPSVKAWVADCRSWTWLSSIQAAANRLKAMVYWAMHGHPVVYPAGFEMEHHWSSGSPLITSVGLWN